MEVDITRQYMEQVVPDLKELIKSSLEDGKAENVVTIDLAGKTDIADYMVIATGTSTKHASFLADKVIQNIRHTDSYGVYSVEGTSEGNWILVDAGNVVVHIFKPGVRELYNLEKMWAMPLPEIEAIEVI